MIEGTRAFEKKKNPSAEPHPQDERLAEELCINRRRVSSLIRMLLSQPRSLSLHIPRCSLMRRVREREEEP